MKRKKPKCIHRIYFYEIPKICLSPCRTPLEPKDVKFNDIFRIDEYGYDKKTGNYMIGLCRINHVEKLDKSMLLPEKELLYEILEELKQHTILLGKLKVFKE